MKIDKKKCEKCNKEKTEDNVFIIMKMGTNKPIQNQYIICYECLVNGNLG